LALFSVSTESGKQAVLCESEPVRRSCFRVESREKLVAELFGVLVGLFGEMVHEMIPFELSPHAIALPVISFV